MGDKFFFSMRAKWAQPGIKENASHTQANFFLLGRNLGTWHKTAENAAADPSAASQCRIVKVSIEERREADTRKFIRASRDSETAEQESERARDEVRPNYIGDIQAGTEQRLANLNVRSWRTWGKRVMFFQQLETKPPNYFPRMCVVRVTPYPYVLAVTPNIVDEVR